MSSITTEAEFLADLSLYHTEKPYLVFWPEDNNDSKPIPTTNIQLEKHDGIVVHDIRGREEDFKLEANGFEIYRHSSAIPLPLCSKEHVEGYKRETEELLKDRLNAEVVFCYEARIRKNDEDTRNRAVIDLRDPLVVERPAAGAHIDATIHSAPNIIKRHLPAEHQSLIGSGRRFRIINTWRPMISVVEDRPLAFIDYFSISRHDLVAVDRITPFQAGEVYMLKYTQNYRWYWLSKMTKDEPLVMLTYDTNPGKGARFCAHAAIDDPSAGPNIPCRQSIETRSIVISKE
ncbi:hypothetical protein F4677DRAFT_36455 [Hypoxylon crocopeplum]|nr:hypothetical protein F4677DRAFT_36455 [Hypoxylon crocopeplum]